MIITVTTNPPGQLQLIMIITITGSTLKQYKITVSEYRTPFFISSPANVRGIVGTTLDMIQITVIEMRRCERRLPSSDKEYFTAIKRRSTSKVTCKTLANSRTCGMKNTKWNCHVKIVIPTPVTKGKF